MHAEHTRHLMDWASLLIPPHAFTKHLKWMRCLPCVICCNAFVTQLPCPPQTRACPFTPLQVLEFRTKKEQMTQEMWDQRYRTAACARTATCAATCIVSVWCCLALCGLTALMLSHRLAVELC